MKIPLHDPIWTRLYDAYGNRSAHKLIARLAEEWDHSVARTLFWDDLHHQNDIYPATFAALPWLWNIAPKGGKGRKESLLFISHVIHCAHETYGTGCDGQGPRGRFRGLSTRISDHHHDWLAEEIWLQDEDQPVLISLEDWFARHAEPMAEQCLHLVGDNLALSAQVISGFVAVKGCTLISAAAEMFSEGETVDIIEQDLGAFGAEQSRVIAALYPHIYRKNAALTAFLLDYPGCSFAPGVSDRLRCFRALLQDGTGETRPVISETRAGYA